MSTFKQGMTASLLALLLAATAHADENASATTAETTADTTENTGNSAEASTGITSAFPADTWSTPRLEDSRRLLHLVATTGLSYGGDTVGQMQYTNGNSRNIKAGGLFYIAGGLGLDIPRLPLTLQVLGGYQIDDSPAENGSATFDRNTLEAQLFFRRGNHRFGIGTVQHKQPEFVGKVDGQPDDRVEFEDSTGFSLEYDYLPISFNWPFHDSRLGFSVRFVQIDYKANRYNGMAIPAQTFSGNHVAAGLYAYF